MLTSFAKVPWCMMKAGPLEHEEEGDTRQSPEHCRTFYSKRYVKRLDSSHENGVVKADCFLRDGL